MAGRGTPATALLSELGIAHTVHTYRHDPRHASYGLEASDALGVPPERVFKTLVAEVDGALTVGVVPVTGQLDLKALAVAAGGKKAAMAGVTAAERATGYVAGGISPLGQRRRLPVVVDASAMRFPAVFCSGGRRGLEIELAPADLIRAAGAAVAPIARFLLPPSRALRMVVPEARQKARWEAGPRHRDTADAAFGPAPAAPLTASLAGA